MILRALQKKVSQHNPSQTNLTIDVLVDEIFEKGNFEKVDLLGIDIFGSE